MSNCLHQSQPAQTSMQEQELTPLQIIGKPAELMQIVKQQQIQFKKFINQMKNLQGQQFQKALKNLNKFFEKGQTQLLTNQVQVLKKMMNYFIKLSKQVEKNQKAQSKMLFILSLIAEMIKQSPKFYFPFNRKFMLKVFQIDSQSLQYSPFKCRILAILAVIYNNLSMQGRLIHKLNIEKELKNALLTNYHLIDQLFTLKLFNRSILNLSSKNIVFTSAEFTKNNIIETISKFIAKNKVEMFLSRMNTCLFQSKPNCQNQKKLVL